MTSTKNLAVVILALLTIGGAVIAFRQQLELQELRAAALGGDDRGQLQRRALAAEKRAQSLEDELLTARGQLNDAEAAAKAKAEPAKPPASTAPGGSMRAMMNTAVNMMNRPEQQRLMAMQAKAALDGRYAPLFKQLNLAPDQLDALKKLMVERQTVGADVFAAAAQQGLDPMQNRAELAKLTAEGQAKVDGEIQSLLGDTSYSSYQNYQATLPQRSVVNQLQQSLSYTPNPLTDTQTEQLVQILAQNQPPRLANASSQSAGAATMIVTASSGGGGDVASAMGPATVTLGGAMVTDAAVAASRAVLSDPQVAALQQLQQQQTQMRAVMQSMGGPPGQSGTTVLQINSAASATPPPPPPSPAGNKPPGG